MAKNIKKNYLIRPIWKNWLSFRLFYWTIPIPGDMWKNFFLTKGITIQPEFELGSHELLLEFAKINLGVACVTKEFSEEFLGEGLLHEVTLTEPIPKRSIGICYLKNVPLNRAAERFVDIMEENMR